MVTDPTFLSVELCAIEVCLNREPRAPAATFGGEYLHTPIPAMAAACLFNLCQAHAFIDGNKRVGANAALPFLLLNHWVLEITEDELVHLVLGVASGVISKARLTSIFEERCCPTSPDGG
jgi:death-on-curing protein